MQNLKENLVNSLKVVEEIKNQLEQKFATDSHHLKELLGHIEQDIRQYKAKIKEVEEGFKTNKDELAVKLSLLSSEVKQKYEELLSDKFLDSIHKVKSEGLKFEELLDLSVLKLKLGQMETKDILNKSKEKLEKESHKVLDLLSAKLEQLKQKL